MRSRTIDQAYQTIRGYVPQDAQRILSEQIPKIEKFIDDEMDKFGEELSEWIGAQVKAAVESTEAEARDAVAEAKSAVEVIKDDLAQGDLVLEAAVRKLEESLDRYEKRFEDIGKGVRTAVVAAARGAGIPPIPGL